VTVLMANRRMQTRGIWTALAAALLVAALVHTTAAADEVIDRVLAVVAGDVITLGDVMAARDLGLVTVAASADPIRAILSTLIDRSLVLAEVDRYAPPEPDAASIDREVEAVRARFSDARAFEAALARVGMDDKYLRETLRQDLRIRAYLQQRFTVPSPTDDELGAYYREHAQAFVRDGRPLSFDDARAQVLEAATAERRQALVDAWVAGLRRRAEITDLYLGSPVEQ
jgi:hypothetical protein